jgi:hypothetical protein
MKDRFQGQIFPPHCDEGFSRTFQDLTAGWIRATLYPGDHWLSEITPGILHLCGPPPERWGVRRHVLHELVIDNLSFPPFSYQENIFGCEPRKSVIRLVAGGLKRVLNQSMSPRGRSTGLALSSRLGSTFLGGFSRIELGTIYI